MPTVGKIILESDTSETALFLRLRGQPLGSGTIVEPFTRPGIDGISFVKLSKQGRPFTLIGFRDFETMQDASNAGESLAGKIKGQSCTIIDSSGREWSGMMCLDVRPREPLPVLKGIGGLTNTPGAVIEIEMDFVCRT